MAAGEIGLSGAVSEKLSLFSVLMLGVTRRPCTRLSCLLENISMELYSGKAEWFGLF